LKRREFLISSLGLIAAPIIIPASALGKAQRPAASRRVTLGFIGTGGKGMDNIKGLSNDPRVQIVAVCDVDRGHLAEAHQIATRKYGKGVLATGDFRDITRRPDIDAVVVSTPDHWHVLPALDAVRHGKDGYVEKPLTLTIAEGRLLSDETARYGRIIQTGSQQRSIGEFRRLTDLVRNGRIGQLQRIEIMIPARNKTNPDPWQPEKPPAELDYNFWLGPAPWEPYHEKRCHYTFRYLRDYSGGQVTNWGTHYIDNAQWCMDMDHSGPVHVEGHGIYPKSGLFDVADDVNFTCTYANGVKLNVRTRKDGVYDGNIRFIGSEGWIFASRSSMVSQPENLVKDFCAATEPRLDFTGVDHFTNFVDCVISRNQPIAPVEGGHRSATVCHLGNTAMELGRPLQWDPVKEEYVGDPDANRLRDRIKRVEWDSKT
jgi:predicted dehydrogenase